MFDHELTDVQCNANQQCISSSCITPTTGQPSKFPPDVTPASTAKGGWLLATEGSNYNVNTGSVPEAWFVDYAGKRTVNTRCIKVPELEFAGPNIAANTRYIFGSPHDSCCIAVFKNSECTNDQDPNQTIKWCNGEAAEGNQKPPTFDVYSWMVYGCTGLYDGQFVPS